MKISTVLALSFIMIIGCAKTSPLNIEPVAAGEGMSLKNVKVTSSVKQKIGDPLKRGADVQAAAKIDLMAKAGGDIEQIFKKRGDMVQEGDIILKLKSDDLELQRKKAALSIKSAQEAISSARTNAQKDIEVKRQELSNSINKMEQGLEIMLRDYNKMKNDFDTGTATKEQLFQMEKKLTAARKDLEQLKQKYDKVEPVDSGTGLDTQLKSAQMSLIEVNQSTTGLTVKAPVSGLLTEMPIEMGMTIQPGTKIGVILKVDPIKIIAQLNEEEMKLVNTKTELSYNLPDKTEIFKGRISYLSKVIDPETKAYELNLEVPNPEMVLKPGQKLWVQLTDEEDRIVVTVPSYSIVKEGEESYIFVLSGDVVEKRKVQLGQLNEIHQEVLSGITEGEQVVISNPGQLKDKEKVQLAGVQQQKAKVEGAE